jgi:hypothetical protein
VLQMADLLTLCQTGSAPAEAVVAAVNAMFPSDDENGDDDTHDGGGAARDDTVTGIRIPVHRMQSSMTDIRKYAESDSTETLRLTADHTFHEREALHRVASKYGLVSRSIGVDQNRCIQISRYTAFVPLSTNIGQQAVEYSVAKPNTSTRSHKLIRGFVKSFDPARERWTVLWEDNAVEILDLITLNTHIKCHHDALNAFMGGSPATADPRLSTTRESDEMVKAMLADINDDWEGLKLKYDPRHWMCCFMSVCQGDPNSPLYKQCLHDLSEALFMHNVQDRLALTEYLRDVRHMDPDQIKAVPPSWFHKRERRYIQPPDIIIPRLADWYFFYRDLPDPAKGGRLFFAPNHLQVFKKELKYVTHGYLSDKPGVDYYIPLPTPQGNLLKSLVIL